jgi:uncharacterized protein (TIRG00374 family)
MLNSKTKIKIKYFGGILLLLACIYYAKEQVNLTEMSLVFQSINILPVILSIPVILLSNLLRAYRWKLLLQVIKPEIKINSVFGSIMVGHLLNSFSIKFGEIARPIVLAEKEKISKTSVIASAIIEGLADFVFILTSFVICLILMTSEISTALNFDYGDINSNIYVYLIISFVLIFLLIVFRKIILNSIYSKLSYELRLKCEQKIELLKLGFSSIRDLKSLIALSLNTLFLWFTYALVMYILFLAFDFQSTKTLTFFDSIIIVIFAGIATALGFTPASVGVYHLIVASIIISLYSIESSQAYAYATLAHFMNLLVQSTFGLYYYIRFGIKSST